MKLQATLHAKICPTGKMPKNTWCNSALHALIIKASKTTCGSSTSASRQGNSSAIAVAQKVTRSFLTPLLANVLSGTTIGSWFDFKHLHGDTSGLPRLQHTAQLGVSPAANEGATVQPTTKLPDHVLQHLQRCFIFAKSCRTIIFVSRGCSQHIVFDSLCYFIQDVVSRYPLALFNEFSSVLTYLSGTKTKTQRHIVSVDVHLHYFFFHFFFGAFVLILDFHYSR